MSKKNRSAREVEMAAKAEMKSKITMPGEMIGKAPKAMLIPAKNLSVLHERAQRKPANNKAVKELAAAMDLDALGTITVSDLGGGRYHLIDGQTRVAALMLLGLGDWECRCNVYQNLSIQQEAGLFRLLNTARIVSRFDKFDKGVVAKDKRCCHIKSICQSHDWVVDVASRDGRIACIEALEKVYDEDGSGDLLNRTIGFITDTYGTVSEAGNSGLVRGVGQFLSEQNGVDLKVLSDKTRARFHLPGALVRQAKSRKENEGGSIGSNVAQILEVTMNSRKRRL